MINVIHKAINQKGIKVNAVIQPNIIIHQKLSKLIHLKGLVQLLLKCTPLFSFPKILLAWFQDILLVS